MAVIAQTSIAGSGSRAATETTLTETNSIAYVPGSILILRNDTGAGVTANIDGDGGTTVPVAGVGSVDVSGGYSTGSIAAGASVAIPLDTIAQYLKGTIAVTGTGLVATYLAP
jgi:hypothetical protein